MRALIRILDRKLRRYYGVYEFSDSPECLLRLRLTYAAHDLVLPEGRIPTGSPILELHMWNEHVPRIPDVGPNFAWARKIQRMAIFSFKEAAAYIQNEPKIKENKAIGGPSAIFTWGIQSGGESLMRRLGFTILPYRNPLGRFGEFWENFYTWLLIWTFNAPSSRQRKLWLMKRSEIWMSASEFLRRYGYPSNPI